MSQVLDTVIGAVSAAGVCAILLLLLMGWI